MTILVLDTFWAMLLKSFDMSPKIGGLYEGDMGDYLLLLEVRYGNPDKMLCNPDGIPNTTASPYWVQREPKTPLINPKFWSITYKTIVSFAVQADMFGAYFNLIQDANG